jgi:hypothetical protein
MSSSFHGASDLSAMQPGQQSVGGLEVELSVCGGLNLL